MPTGHGTTAAIGGGLIAAGSVPGGFGAYEVIGSGASPWGNAWFVLGAILWAIGVIIVVGAGLHFLVHWWRHRTQQGTTLPATINVNITVNTFDGRTGAFLVMEQQQTEVRVREDVSDAE